MEEIQIEVLNPMYDWLDHLMQHSSTPKYFWTHAASDSPPECLQAWPVRPPVDYIKFIERFGSVRLFRELSYYVIHVNARPIQMGSFLAFGHCDAVWAAFLHTELEEGGICLVYAIDDNGNVIETWPNFAGWIYDRVGFIRDSLSNQEWEDICKGPTPFSKHEQHIVKLRRKYRLLKHEIGDNGKHLIQIENRSEGRIPYLTVDVAYSSDDLLGGFWLPVEGIDPGQRAWIEKAPYPNVTKPADVEIWIADEPEPQDRDRYWEFR